ncbi:MAG: AzlC family ABC transporter permease [Firmicutes bacterium]|nr:AzlC family ABC transporter permease [Bacillota bacterium]
MKLDTKPSTLSSTSTSAVLTTLTKAVAGGFLSGVKIAIPIMLGYVPIGFAYGVLARQAGLSVIQATAMSLAVYAGSSQFIAVAMLTSGAGATAIVSTTFLVNLRHLLFSASMVPYFRRFSIPALAILSFGITDETYAAGIGQYSREKPRFSTVLGLHLASYLSWVVASLVGASVSSLVGSASDLGLDFALPAMFIALLISQLKNKTTILVAVLSGFISLGVSMLGWNTLNVIVATVISATLGVFWNLWTKRHS